MRRVQFTVRQNADCKLTCNRCQRPLRAGQDAVTILTRGLAVHRHAGRTCPPPPARVYNPALATPNGANHAR